jgi:hypothetical protein
LSFEKKKFAFPAPAVPDVNSMKGRRGQSSIGASCYRFEQIFRLEINVTGFQKSLIFRPKGFFFNDVSPGFEGKQSIWEPARDGYFDFLLRQKSNGY